MREQARTQRVAVERQLVDGEGSSPFAIAFRSKEDPYGLDGRGLVGVALLPVEDRNATDNSSWRSGDDVDTGVERATLTCCQLPPPPRAATGCALVWEVSDRTRGSSHYSGCTRAGAVDLGGQEPWIEPDNHYATDPTYP